MSVQVLRACSQNGVLARLACMLVLSVFVAPLPASAANEETQRRIRFNEGIVSFTNRDYAAAERVFSSLVAEQPTDASAHYWLGLSLLQRNRYQSALAAFEQVLEISPDKHEVRLDIAIAMIGLERFEEALQQLDRFLEADTTTAEARTLATFFKGLCHYKLKRYEQALAEFEQVETSTEDATMLANVSWYRAWVLAEQEQLEEAAESFDRVTELSTDVDQQARAKTLSREVRDGVVTAEVEHRPLQLKLELGLSYDSNVVLLGQDTSLPIDFSSDEDFRFGLSTRVRYTRPFGEGKWLWGIGGSTYHSWHASLQEFNVQTYGGQLFLNYFASDRLAFGLQYEYDFNLVNNSAFLSRHRITSSMRWIEALHDDGSPLTSTTFFYSFEDRNYHEALTDIRDNRDGDYQSFGFVQHVNISQPRLEYGDERWLELSIGYRMALDSTAGSNFDATAHTVSAGLGVPLPDGWEMNVSGRWSWEDYWQRHSQDRRKRGREDFVCQYVWSVGKEFELDSNITMGLRGDIVWVADDSNIRNRLREAVFSYDRVIYGLSLSFVFN